MITINECPEVRIDIFIAGPRAVATEICARYCERGMCVRVADCDYIYTHGRETGVVVSLVNYARFPSAADALWGHATALAKDLMYGLSQRSCSIIGAGRSAYFQRLQEGAPK